MLVAIFNDLPGYLGRIRNTYGISAGNSEETGLLGIPKHRWEDNIKKDSHIHLDTR
jgi:hypothetical protein